MRLRTHHTLCASLCALGLQGAGGAAQAVSTGDAPVAPLPGAAAEDVLGGLRITLFGNLLGRRDDNGLRDEEGNSLDDRVYLRSLGARLTAPVAELGRGVAFLRWSESAGGGFDSQLDEAYLETRPLELPWEALSERLTLRVGRFRAPLGRANRWHVHELPQITRPLVIRELLGEDGLVQTGLACTLDVPTGSERVDFLFTAELARDFPLDEAFTPFLNLAVGFEAGPRDRIDVGASIDNSREQRDFGFQSSLRGVDVLFSHRPEQVDAAGAFFLGGEVLDSKVSLPTETIRPTGYYVWSQLEFVPRWFAGARFEKSDDIADDGLASRVFGGYLGWAPHPRLRVGLGYEHTRSDDPALNGLDTLLLEVNFGFGSPTPGPSWLEPGFVR